jgi:hypothetical protein
MLLAARTEDPLIVKPKPKAPQVVDPDTRLKARRYG